MSIQILLLLRIKMNSYTKEHNYPSPSISLQPISDHETHPFICQCLMCNNFIVKKQGQLLRQQEEKMLREKNQQTTKRYPESHLETVLKCMVIPTNKIVKRGIEVFAPEICFFEGGEPTALYYTRDPEDYHLIKMKKEKINQTILQKILNEHRRSYRERVRRRLHLPREVSIRKGRNSKKQGGVTRLESMHAVVIKYTDGCESLLTENELINILLRRKTDPFWKKIAFIKNYMGPLSSNQEESSYIDIHFDFERPIYPDLMKRAQLLMKIYSTKIIALDDEYISDEEEAGFCSQLRHQSKKIFGTYSFYKIVAFMTQFSDEQVTRAQAKIFVNELGQAYLIEVKELSLDHLVKYNFTPEICAEMLQQQEHNKYHRQKLNSNPRIQAMSARIEELMRQQYDQMKDRYGVSVKPRVDENQKQNNQFFKFLYPDLPGQLSQLIKEDIPFSSFRRKYLGQEKKRRTLFQPFTSKFVRELHRLTPIKTRSSSVSSRSGQRSAIHQTIPVAQTARNSTIDWRRRSRSSTMKMSQTIAV